MQSYFFDAEPGTILGDIYEERMKPYGNPFEPNFYVGLTNVLNTNDQAFMYPRVMSKATVRFVCILTFCMQLLRAKYLL